jgi:hypothetical protein
MKDLRRKIAVVVAVSVIGLFVFPAPNAAALIIGFPDISFDSSQGPGQNTFTSGAGVFFDAGTQFLSVSAKALSITFNGLTSTALVNGTVDYQVKLVSASSSGGLVTGNFGTNMIAGSDLIVTDNTGTLLTGDFLSYTLNGILNTNIGAGQARFSVTGGSLAPQFTVGTGGMVHLEFNMTPAFTAGSFASNFSGQVKGDIGPVPEPGTLLLIGSGLVGIAVGNRRRTRQK